MNQFNKSKVVASLLVRDSHVVLSVLLMHALDSQSCEFNVQPIEIRDFTPPPPCPFKIPNRDTPSKMREVVDSVIRSGLV